RQGGGRCAGAPGRAVGEPDRDRGAGTGRAAPVERGAAGAGEGGGDPAAAAGCARAADPVRAPGREADRGAARGRGEAVALAGEAAGRRGVAEGPEASGGADAGGTLDEERGVCMENGGIVWQPCTA